VRDAIHALRSAERAIVICTHNLAEAEELADMIAIIRRGKIIAQGSPAALKHSLLGPPEQGSPAALKQSLLGPPEYEVRLGSPQNLRNLKLPLGLKLSEWGPDWLRYQTVHPMQENPIVLRSLLEQGLPVVSLEEVPRSLEQVYLQAIKVPQGAEVLRAE